MTPKLKLPIAAVAAVLFALSLAELVLLPQASPVPAVIAVHVVVLGTLLFLPRRPVLVLALILLELFLVKELQINQMVSVALSLLGPFAAFAAAALAPTRRLPLVALLLAAHLVWRATLPSGDTVTIIVTTALLASAAAAGALLHRGSVASRRSTPNAKAWSRRSPAGPATPARLSSCACGVRSSSGSSR